MLILWRATKSTFCSRTGYVPAGLTVPVVAAAGGIVVAMSGT